MTEQRGNEASLGRGRVIIKKRIITLTVTLSMVMLIAGGCTGEGSNNGKKEVKIDPVEVSREVNTEIAACSAINTDEELDSRVVNAWWNNWPRFSPPDRAATSVFAINANAVSTPGGDQGWGPYFREDQYGLYANYYWVPEDAAYDVKKTVWMESMGTMVGFVGEVSKNADNEYIINSQTDAPRLERHRWNWYGENESASQNNEIVWIGMHAYANSEPWQGKYARGSEMPEPQYPDGTSAVGYFDDNATDPRKAKFYDALAAKDINGKLTMAFQTTPHQLPGTVSLNEELGEPAYGLYFTAYRDVASPWWGEYNRQVAKYFLEKGMDGFWVDHSMGFNYAIESAVQKGFGEWSVAGFRNFLAEKLDAEVLSTLQISDLATFDIRLYLKAKFSEWFPNDDPANVLSSKWSDPRWNDEPIWQAYIAYKAEVVARNAQYLYNAIKEEAQLLGKDPNDVLVYGNDFTRVHVPGITGKEMDIVSAEYMPHYAVVTGNFKDGLPHEGVTGPYYALATQAAQGRHAVTWYYLQPEYASKTNLAQLISYEALANNAIITGGSSHLYANVPGTDESALSVNNFIERMAPVFGSRERSGAVGILYSTETEYSYMAPGGYRVDGSPGGIVPGELPSVLEYYGWATAFERLHVPYRAISDYKLTSESLQGLSVLILPLVEAISQEAVDEVIVPFVEAGGTVIVVGEESGKRDSAANLYQNRTTPALAELASREFSNGQVILMPKQPSSLEGPGGNYYKMLPHNLNNQAVADSMFEQISRVVDNLYTTDCLVQTIELDGFAGSTTAVQHIDRSQSRLFIDLVSRDYDLENDYKPVNEGGKLTARLPLKLASNEPTVQMYVPESEEPINLVWEQREGGTLDIVIPAFQFYASIVIE